MSTDHDCSCGDCTTADLPFTPFEALRARHGMLLGEDDFRSLMGNPRGKQMLHSAWLHGTGVVWGYEVRKDGLLALAVRPGLAMDGWGRELALTATATVDLQGWLREHDRPDNQDGCRTRTVPACLVAEFDCATARPVPTLADPCDVTRTHDTASRILEQTRVSLVPGHCRSCHCHDRYHRLRVLLDLDEVERDDRPGREAAEARADVADRPKSERTAAFCHHLQCLGGRDAADLRPACAEGTDIPTLFPVAEQDAAVVLACVEIDVRDADGCTTIEDVRLDDCCRCLLLPTQVITELLCAVAARVFGRHRQQDHDHEHDYDHEHEHDQGGYGERVEGPRVLADEVSWDEDERCYLVPVTGELVVGSIRRAVTVTSLSARGWIEEDVDSVRYDPDRSRIVVRMETRPQNAVVRLLVKGTGPTPAYGVDPAAPLAGVLGGPPGGRHAGHDAVVTVTDRPRTGKGS